jgi:hypothetical protein
LGDEEAAVRVILDGWRRDVETERTGGFRRVWRHRDGYAVVVWRKGQWSVTHGRRCCLWLPIDDTYNADASFREPTLKLLTTRYVTLQLLPNGSEYDEIP